MRHQATDFKPVLIVYSAVKMRCQPLKALKAPKNRQSLRAVCDAAAWCIYNHETGTLCKTATFHEVLTLITSNPHEGVDFNGWEYRSSSIASEAVRVDLEGFAQDMVSRFV